MSEREKARATNRGGPWRAWVALTVLLEGRRRRATGWRREAREMKGQRSSRKVNRGDREDAKGWPVFRCSGSFLSIQHPKVGQRFYSIEQYYYDIFRVTRYTTVLTNTNKHATRPWWVHRSNPEQTRSSRLNWMSDVRGLVSMVTLTLRGEMDTWPWVQKEILCLHSHRVVSRLLSKQLFQFHWSGVWHSSTLQTQVFQSELSNNT